MGRFMRALFGNMLLKLSALVCAGVLWVYVDGFVQMERAIVATPRTDPATRLTVEGEPRIEVTVRGPSRRVRLLSAADVTYSLNPGEIQTGSLLERTGGHSAVELLDIAVAGGMDDIVVTRVDAPGLKISHPWLRAPVPAEEQQR